MTRTPSSSDSAPATTAAAASPSECPMTAPGAHPVGLHRRRPARPAWRTCVGWTRSMPVTVSGADIASVTENPDSCSDQRLDLGDRGGERRLVRQQFGAHRRPTANPARRTPTPARGRRVPTAGGTESRRRRPRAAPRSARQLLGDHRGAHRPVRTPARQGVGQIRGARRRLPPCASTQSASRPAVRRSSSADVDDSGNSSGPSTSVARASRPCERRCSFGCLLHDGVHVGSGHAVRRHRRPPGADRPLVGHGVTGLAAQRVRCRSGRARRAAG